MLCCHAVLGSVHSSSHLFVPFLQTQYLWNTFPFMTVFLTKEWPTFDRSKVNSQYDRLCRWSGGSWFDYCLEYEGMGLKQILSEKTFFFAKPDFGDEEPTKAFSKPAIWFSLSVSVFGGWPSSSSSFQQSPQLRLSAETTPVCVSTATGC